MNEEVKNQAVSNVQYSETVVYNLNSVGEGERDYGSLLSVPLKPQEEKGQKFSVVGCNQWCKTLQIPALIDPLNLSYASNKLVENRKQIELSASKKGTTTSRLSP